MKFEDMAVKGKILTRQYYDEVVELPDDFFEKNSREHFSAITK